MLLLPELLSTQMFIFLPSCLLINKEGLLNCSMSAPSFVYQEYISSSQMMIQEKEVLKPVVETLKIHQRSLAFFKKGTSQRISLELGGVSVQSGYQGPFGFTANIGYESLKSIDLSLLYQISFDQTSLSLFTQNMITQSRIIGARNAEEVLVFKGARSLGGLKLGQDTKYFSIEALWKLPFLGYQKIYQEKKVWGGLEERSLKAQINLKQSYLGASAHYWRYQNTDEVHQGTRDLDQRFVFLLGLPDYNHHYQMDLYQIYFSSKQVVYHIKHPSLGFQQRSRRFLNKGSGPPEPEWFWTSKNKQELSLGYEFWIHGELGFRYFPIQFTFSKEISKLEPEDYQESLSLGRWRLMFMLSI
jgi:hypothetical protein